MHTYRLLASPEEIEQILLPVLIANGSEIPPTGCFIAAVEFDEAGAVVAYQMAQNALFLEGMWARDSSAHLLTIYRLATRYLIEKLKVARIMTMTRKDETGQRIGRIAKALGYEDMQWNVFRRKL